MLQSHKMSKCFYHSGDSKANDVRRLMARGIGGFNEIKVYLYIHKLEIDLNCTNFSSLYGLIDRIFSTLHERQ